MSNLKENPVQKAKKIGSLLAFPLVVVALALTMVAVGSAQTDSKKTYTILAGSCVAHKDGYTLRYQAHIPLVNYGDGDLNIEKWRTRFSFTHQGGGDPLHLASRTGNNDTFYSDDAWTGFPDYFSGDSVPYNVWVKHDGTDRYGRIDTAGDSPYIELDFDMPGDDPHCVVDLHVQS